MWLYLCTNLYKKEILSVCYCIYSMLKFTKKPKNPNVNDLLQELFGDRQWKDGRANSTPVFLCSCFELLTILKTFTPSKLKIPCLSNIFFWKIFCTYIYIKLYFTCVCLPSPCRSLLKSAGVELALFWSLCIVSKPGAKKHKWFCNVI